MTQIAEIINKSILESLKERDSKMCNTWNRDEALAVAYAVKVQLSQDEAKGNGDYIRELSGKEIVIDGRVRVEIVKADLKERNEKATLIMRYKYVDGL